MNNIEKVVYDLLKHNPKFKIFVRNLYQNLLDIIPTKQIKVFSEFKNFKNYFFGFHDLNPFSSDNSKLLANHSMLLNVSPKLNDVLKVGYINLTNNEFNEIGISTTWNFHKGARLQWIDENKVIYNSHFADGNFNSTIKNLKSKKEEILPAPIDTVSNNGKLATSFSYSRLEYLMLGYGYLQTDKDNYNEERGPKRTGISIIDLESKTINLIFSIRYLVDFAGLNKFAEDRKSVV